MGSVLVSVIISFVPLSFSYYFVTASRWVLVLVSLTKTVQFLLTKVFVLVLVNENNTNKY